MIESLMQVSEYKLTDLLSSAGATIGVIISGTILLQFLSTKYLDLLTRYRSLTGEYRSGPGSDPRRGSVQQQIRIYYRRLWLTARASWLAAGALICFVVAVLVGGLSMMYPQARPLKVPGVLSLFVGLLSFGGAALLTLCEMVLARHEVGEELGDFEDLSKESENWHVMH